MQDIKVSRDLCKELDEKLVPILGKAFTISRGHDGAYIFHAENGRVVSILPASSNHLIGKKS